MPMLFLPDLPARRTPPRIGIGVPVSDKPMRRLKNRSVCTGADVNELPVPMVKKFEFSRKKSRFSGIEQAEPRQVDLLLVDFHLREVGVDGDVHVEAGGHAVARIEADVADRIGVARRPARLHVVHAADQERFQPQIEAARDLREAVQLAGHADARQRVGLRDRRPQHAFVLAADVALEVDAPHLRVARHESHGAERNLDLGGPALIVDARRRVPHAVPVAIDVRGGAAAAAFAFVEDLLFELGAERRGQEHVAVARIVEGVEDDLEVVFVEQPVRIAPHFGGGDGERRRRRERRCRGGPRRRGCALRCDRTPVALPAAPAARSDRSTGADFQSASSRMPSTFTGCAARTARATGFSVGIAGSLMVAGLALGGAGC